MKAIFELYGIKYVLDLPKPPPPRWQFALVDNDVVAKIKNAQDAAAEMPDDGRVTFDLEQVQNDVAFYKITE